MSPVQTPLHYWHRIVQREGKYYIQSTCVQCGEERTGPLTETIVEWEYEHACGSAATSPLPRAANEEAEEYGFVRRVLRFLSRASRAR